MGFNARERSEFAEVVMIEQVSMSSHAVFFQRSRIPAKAKPNRPPG